jgi:hypothetical protein
MNWDAIGAIAELLGAIAVVATLAYLSVQLRQNTASVRASSAAAHSEAMRTSNIAVVQDPELVRLYWSGLANRAALSDDDQRRFDFLIGITTGGMEQAWKFKQDGVLDAPTWAGQAVSLSWLAHQPGFADFWRIWGSAHHPGFGEVIAQAMAEGLHPEAVAADRQTATADPSRDGSRS